MTFGQLLLITGILFFIAVHDIVAADEDFRNIQPLHYTIKLQLYPKIWNDDTFYGEYNVSFRPYYATQTIILHLENIFVYKPKVLTRLRSKETLKQQHEFMTITFTNDFYTVIHTPIFEKYNYIDKTLTLTFFELLHRNIHTLNLKFFGRLSNNYKGLFKIPVTNDEKNISWITATNTLFTEPCKLFPCLGDPTDKINFTISIEHHISEISLSSMSKKQTELSVKKDMLWTHFATDFPMSIYEITFLLLPQPSNITSISTGSIVLWSRIENIAFKEKYINYELINYEPQLFDVANKVVSFYTTKFGELKISRIQFIAIPGFQHDAIATLGFILHREEDILVDQKFEVTSIVQRNNIWRFVARQIALQWFLESFKPSIRRSYEWFNAVAEFFGVYALDKIFKTSKMMNWFVVHTVHDSLHLDVDNLMKPITYIRDTSLNTTYLRVPPFVKVSTLLRMMENQDEHNFWSNTREYLLNKSLTFGNKWICFLYDRASFTLRGEISEYNKNCLSWKWIEVTSTYPLVRVEERSTCNFEIYIRFNTSGKNTENCTDFCFGAAIFLAFLYELRHEQSYGPINLAWIGSNYPIGIPGLQNETKECILILNLNHNVYCRVQYAYQNPEMFINASSYANLPVLTRAQIIDDEYHLLVEKKKTFSMLPTIIRYLYNETEYEVWYPVIRILEEMSGIFPFSDDKDIISFKETMSVVLNKLTHNLEVIRDVKEFQSCLRYESIKWTCLFNSTLCYSFKEKKMKDMIQDLNQVSLIYNQIELLSHPWQEWLHCDGLKHYGANTHALTKIILNSKLFYKNNFSDVFVKYLPCIGFNVALQYLNGTRISDTLHVILFESLVAKHVNTHITEIINYFSLMKPRTMKSHTALCVIINHIYSPSVFNKLIKSVIFMRPSNIFFRLPPNIDRVRQKIVLRQSQITKRKNNFKTLWNMK